MAAMVCYVEFHIVASTDNVADESLNVPSQRKPLSGRVTIHVRAVADVDHTTSRYRGAPGLYVAINCEDLTDPWTTRPCPTKDEPKKGIKAGQFTDEPFGFDVDKANEIEVTVYEKTGGQTLPIGILWLRVSDIAEEMRRQKIASELQNNNWVSADKIGGSSGPQPDMQFQPPPGQSSGGVTPGGMRQTGGAVPGSQHPSGPIEIDGWFSLEPVGRINLTLSFVKHNKNKQPFEVGLGRKGAIRQRKEEVFEQYGHKFVVQQFYNIMRCALCGDFLKYGTGMQCSDCRYTCHKKCFPKVVTKCITQSNAETDPDEAKLNHRIPHRFENATIMGAYWCCHCGYLLPLGRGKGKQCKGTYYDLKSPELALTRLRMQSLLSRRMSTFRARSLRHVYGESQSDIEGDWANENTSIGFRTGSRTGFKHEFTGS